MRRPPPEPEAAPDPQFRMSDQSRRILRRAVRRPHPGAAYSQRTRFEFMADRAAECTFSPAVNNMSVILDSIVHGGTGGSSRVRIMEDRERRRQHRLRRAREQQSAGALSGCTFRPQLSHGTQRISRRATTTPGTNFASDVAARVEHHAAQVARRRDRLRRERDAAELSECTFQPQLGANDRGVRRARTNAERAAASREADRAHKAEYAAMRMLPSIYYTLPSGIDLQPPPILLSRLATLPGVRRAALLARLPDEAFVDDLGDQYEYEYYEYEYEEQYAYEYEEIEDAQPAAPLPPAAAADVTPRAIQPTPAFSLPAQSALPGPPGFSDEGSSADDADDEREELDVATPVPVLYETPMAGPVSVASMVSRPTTNQNLPGGAVETAIPAELGPQPAVLDALPGPADPWMRSDDHPSARNPKSTVSAVALGFGVPVSAARPGDVDALFTPSTRMRRTLDEVDSLLGY